MILRYRLLAERLRVELKALQRIVARAEAAVVLARKRPAEQDYFLGSAALDLHAFYTGVERLLELIASDLDESRPATPHWHRDLLAQMSLVIPDVRPAVLRTETSAALIEYLEFRHVVRNATRSTCAPTAWPSWSMVCAQRFWRCLTSLTRWKGRSSRRQFT